MRLLFVADGRSPTTLNWMHYWIEGGHETHLVSTYPCIPPAGLASFHVLPVAFSQLAGRGDLAMGNNAHRPLMMRSLRGPFLRMRYYLGPLSLPVYRKRFLRRVYEIQPDLVHALRIPFEGMLAKILPPQIPLVISIWGNDITLHAKGSFLMVRQTRQTLQRADGLIADTNRDIRLGGEWGFSNAKPHLVVPGGGGIHMDRIDESDLFTNIETLPERLPDAPIVVNPRGQRPGSLRQDVFFQAIPLVLERIPQAVFICPSLADDIDSGRWVKSLGIGSNTKLWPRLDRPHLWALLRRAQVFVSPSLHDGTPNSLLEAMACGCLPVVGDIESMREWIQPDVNGLLVDANSPLSLANGIIKALETPSLLETARNKNALIIAERAEYGHCMAMVEAVYGRILAKKGFNAS